MSKIKRCPLAKRIPRDIAKNFAKYAGMMCILICTISVGSSFQSTMDGAVKYLDDIKIENNQEDGFFETLEPVNEETIEYFEEQNIRVAKNFYVTENQFMSEKTDDTENKTDTENETDTENKTDTENINETDSSSDNDCKLLVFNERDEIDIPVLFEGKLPEKDNEIAIDHVFARHKEIVPGDEITLMDKKFIVSGTVSLPDYTALFLNNTDLMMNTTKFCVSVVTNECFEQFEEGDITYRYSYTYDEEDLSKAQKIKVSDDMLKKLVEDGNQVKNFLRADQNQSISFLEMDIGTDGPFMVVFVYMLVALIAFIFAILTNNTIENESVIIGTLLASGYKKSEIIWHYIQTTLIVAVAGSVIGNVLGYTVMINPFVDMYYTMYSIGPIEINFSVSAFLTTTILPVVIMVAINYVMLRRKLSLKPLKFLRRDLKKKKQRKSAKLPDISFLNRFRLRVILQNKSSYIMLFIGIFLASFLLMFGIGLDPLMAHYTETIDESIPFEYQYLLKAPVEAEGGEKLKVYEMEMWFPLGQKDIGVSLMGIEEDSEYFKEAIKDMTSNENVQDGASKEEKTENVVTIASSLANKMNLKIGDEFVLTDSTNDKEYTFKVSDVYEYNATLCIFMKMDDLNKLLGDDEDTYNCLISNSKLDIDDAYIAKQISRHDLVGSTNQVMDSFETLIMSINIFSVIVYMILIYILTRVVIDKNAISISYMKVFGYEQKEIRKVYLTATSMVVIASLIVCIPVEIALFKLVLVFLSSMIEGYMEFYLPAYIYVEIVVIGLLAYYIINALHMRSINKIPMTDALKNRE